MTLLKRRKAPRMGVREPGRIRSTAHLKWLRGHLCAIEGKHKCDSKIEAAHVRIGTDGGTSIKPSDGWTIPLGSGAHREQHAIGEQSFEKRYGIRMKALAEEYWKRSPHRWRHENT